MLEKMGKFVKFMMKYFTLWIVLGAVAAYVYPEPFKPLSAYVSYCIMAVMLSMGLSTSVNDFKLVLTRPKDVFWGIVLRYMIMPFVALALTKILGLPEVLAVGMILVPMSSPWPLRRGGYPLFISLFLHKISLLRSIMLQILRCE